jgi:hypothetical protein
MFPELPRAKILMGGFLESMALAHQASFFQKAPEQARMLTGLSIGCLPEDFCLNVTPPFSTSIPHREVVFKMGVSPRKKSGMESAIALLLYFVGIFFSQQSTCVPLRSRCDLKTKVSVFTTRLQQNNGELNLWIWLQYL